MREMQAFVQQVHAIALRTQPHRPRVPLAGQK
jgi:hypothetical protein